MALATENSIQLDNSNCRICLFAKQNLCPLFRRGLSMKVMKLADIKMYEGDGLPSSICLDCEFEVKRCTNFVAQIQQADAKLREMLAEKEKEVNETCVNDKEIVEGLAEGEEQEASTSQIEIEEFNVKQEITSLDNFIDEKEDFHSDSDHDHFGGGLDNIDQPEDDDELNPLNHVDVVEDINRGDQMDIFTDPLGQEEPLIESHTTEIDPSTDPLTYMKQEAVAMDVDKNMPEVPGPSSSVRTTEASISLNVSPNMLNSKDCKYDLDTFNLQRIYILSMKQKISSLISNNASQNWHPVITQCASICSNTLPRKRKINVDVSKVKQKTKETKKQDPQLLIEEFKNRWIKNDSFCIVCYVDCGSQGMLEEHKEKTEFICRICTTEFKHHADLETHFFGHKPVKCGLCDEISFSRKDHSLHTKQKHQSVRLHCNVCRKTFLSRHTLNSHKNVKHSASGVNFKCVVCEKTFIIPSQLQSHLLKVHSVFESLECKFCEQIFVGPERLKQHVILKHLECGANAFFSCKTCGKHFREAHYLVQHERIHDDTECLCEQCGKSIKGEFAMKKHVYNEHTRKGPFTCKYCNKQFAILNEFKNHLKKCPKKTQKIPTPFFCEICGKQYKTGNILKIHKQIHYDERPYKCETCGATFKQEISLKTHRRVHSSVGKYRCVNCGKDFKWKSTFDKHVKKCNIDNKNTESSSYNELNSP